MRDEAAGGSRFYCPLKQAVADSTPMGSDNATSQNGTAASHSATCGGKKTLSRYHQERRRLLRPARRRQPQASKTASSRGPSGASRTRPAHTPRWSPGSC